MGITLGYKPLGLYVVPVGKLVNVLTNNYLMVLYLTILTLMGRVLMVRNLLVSERTNWHEAIRPSYRSVTLIRGTKINITFRSGNHDPYLTPYKARRAVFPVS
jgi:hypothetical protein